MLKSLAIQNYALIDSLHIDFDKGFSVITRETGAENPSYWVRFP